MKSGGYKPSWLRLSSERLICAPIPDCRASSSTNKAIFYEWPHIKWCRGQLARFPNRQEDSSKVLNKST